MKTKLAMLTMNWWLSTEGVGNVNSDRHKRSARQNGAGVPGPSLRFCDVAQRPITHFLSGRNRTLLQAFAW
jgi:hypothetical protein